MQGLYRYLQDFSNFSDRGVADMVLWDQYLVYAAAFGISDRVMAEFAKAYPQVTDPQWLDAHGAGSLLYWSYRPYGYGYMGGPTAGAGAGGVGGGFDPASFSANFGDFGARLNARRRPVVAVSAVSRAVRSRVAAVSGAPPAALAADLSEAAEVTLSKLADRGASRLKSPSICEF